MWSDTTSSSGSDRGGDESFSDSEHDSLFGDDFTPLGADETLGSQERQSSTSVKSDRGGGGGGQKAEGSASVSKRSPRTQKSRRSFRVHHDEPLLRRNDRCIPASLQERIQLNDVAELEKAVDLIVQLGTPEECRAWVAQHASASASPTCSESGGGGSGGGAVPRKVGQIPFGCVGAPPETRPTTWEGVQLELLVRCDNIRKIIIDAKTSSAVLPYLLPRRLQKKVMPVLYAWVVDWELATTKSSYWGSALRALTAVCRRRPRRGRPTFTLPWKPLLAFLLALVDQPDSTNGMPAFNRVQRNVGSDTLALCRLVTPYFDSTALEGIWDALAPRFSRNSADANVALGLLFHLFPLYSLHDEATGGPLPLTQRIVSFLWGESYFWQPQRSSWLKYMFKLIATIMSENVGLIDMNPYAESFFTALQYLLRLPIGDNTKRSGVSDGLQGFLNASDEEACMASAYIMFALPNDTTTPLWNHLRRFVHATSVFLRPAASSKADAAKLAILYGNMVTTVHLRIKRQRTCLRHRRHQAGRSASLTSSHAESGQVRSIPEPYLWRRSAVETFVQIIAPAVLPTLHLECWKNGSQVLGLLTSLSPVFMQPYVLKYVEAGLSSEVSRPRCYGLKLLNSAYYPLMSCPATAESTTRYVQELLPRLLSWMSLSEMSYTTNATHFIFTVVSTTSLVELLGGQEAECDFMLMLIERFMEACIKSSRNQAGGSAAGVAGGGTTCGATGEMAASTEEVSWQLMSCMRSILATLSPETFRRVAEKVLREAESRENGVAMAYLVASIGVIDPNLVVQFALRVPVPVLLNPTTGDEESVWATHLLSACVNGGRRKAAMELAAPLIRCVHAQLASITSRTRVHNASTLYVNLQEGIMQHRCVGAEMRPRSFQPQGGPPPPAGGGVDSAEDYAGSETPEQQQRLREMGFCTCTNATLIWEEPTAEHGDFLLSLYDRLMTEVVHVMENIEQVVRQPPSMASVVANGLKAFCEEVGSASKGGTNEGDASPTGDSGSASTGEPADGETSKSARGNDSGEPFTPHNVLAGVLQWMEVLAAYNDYLYYEDVWGPPETVSLEEWLSSHASSEPSAPSPAGGIASPTEAKAMTPVVDSAERWGCTVVAAEPWMLKTRRTSITMPLSTGRKPQFSRRFLFEMVRVHVLRRMAGDHFDVEETLSPESVALMDLSLVQSAKPPLEASRVNGGDPRELQRTLRLLLELAHVRGSQRPFVNVFYPLDSTGCVEANFCEPKAFLEYFPLSYWPLRAEGIVQDVFLTPKPSYCLRTYEDAMNLVYLFALSAHPGVRSTCTVAFVNNIARVSLPVRMTFMASQVHFVTQLALQWIAKNSEAVADRDVKMFLRLWERLSSTGETIDNSLGGVSGASSPAPATDAGNTAAAAAAAAASMEEQRQTAMDVEAANEELENDDSEEDTQGPANVLADAAATARHVDVNAVSPTTANGGALGPQSGNAQKTNRTKKLMSAAVIFLVAGFGSMGAGCEDEQVLTQSLLVVLLLPDSLVERTAVVYRKVVSKNLDNTNWSLPVEVACSLVNKLLILAQQLAVLSPVRAQVTLRVARSLYRFQDPRFAISTAAFHALVRLCGSALPRLQVSAISLLTMVLSRTSATPAVETEVCLRQYALEDAAHTDTVVEQFNRRYQALREAFPTLSLGGTSGVFVARSIVVPGVVTLADVSAGGGDELPLAPLPEWTVKRLKYLCTEPMIPHARAAAAPAAAGGGVEGAGTCSRSPTATAPDGSASPSPTCGNEWTVLLRQSLGCTVETCSEGVPAAVLKETRAWRVVEALQDRYRRSQCLMNGSGWLQQGRTLGVDFAVPFYRNLVQLQMNEMQAMTHNMGQAGKESAKGVVTCMLEMAMVMVRLTSTPPWIATPLRRTAVEAYTSVLLYTCDVSVQNADVESVGLSCTAVAASLSTEEVWALYERLFTALRHGETAHGAAAADEAASASSPSTGAVTILAGTVQTNRVLLILLQLMYVCDPATNGELLPKVMQAVTDAESELLRSGTALLRRYAAGLLRQLVRQSMRQSTVLATCRNNLESCLAFARQLMQYVDFGEGPASCGAGAGPEPAHPVLEPWSASPALRACASPSLPRPISMDVLGAAPPLTPSLSPGAGSPIAPGGHHHGGGGSDPVMLLPPQATPLIPPALPTPSSLRFPSQTPPRVDKAGNAAGGGDGMVPSLPPPLPGFSLDGTDSKDWSLVPEELAAVKTITQTWFSPSDDVFSPMSHTVISFLAHALDITLAEVDDLAERVQQTLVSIAFTRLPKATVHAVVDQLCSVLQNQTRYGTSRRAKLTLTTVLRLVIFTNLHRIGKYSTMVSIAEAALCSLGHGDGRLRTEGKLLFSVLTKVASTEQIQALIQSYQRELRAMPASVSAVTTSPGMTPSTATPGAATEISVLRRRRTALVLALCATVAASPGLLPPYIPKLMEYLVQYSRDSNAEIGRAVKKTFEDWWRAHREGWDLEYKAQFTAEQMSDMSTLFMAPTYYV